MNSTASTDDIDTMKGHDSENGLGLIEKKHFRKA